MTDAEIKKRLDDLDKKLDVILLSCCTHSRRVSSDKRGDPIVCEDCETVVGFVQ